MPQAISRTPLARQYCNNGKYSCHRPSGQKSTIAFNSASDNLKIGQNSSDKGIGWKIPHGGWRCVRCWVPETFYHIETLNQNPASRIYTYWGGKVGKNWWRIGNNLPLTHITIKVWLKWGWKCVKSKWHRAFLLKARIPKITHNSQLQNLLILNFINELSTFLHPVNPTHGTRIKVHSIPWMIKNWSHPLTVVLHRNSIPTNPCFRTGLWNQTLERLRSKRKEPSHWQKGVPYSHVFPDSTLSRSSQTWELGILNQAFNASLAPWWILCGSTTTSYRLIQTRHRSKT